MSRITSKSDRRLRKPRQQSRQPMRRRTEEQRADKADGKGPRWKRRRRWLFRLPAIRDRMAGYGVYERTLVHAIQPAGLRSIFRRDPRKDRRLHFRRMKRRRGWRPGR